MTYHFELSKLRIAARVLPIALVLAQIGTAWAQQAPVKIVDAQTPNFFLVGMGAGVPIQSMPDPMSVFPSSWNVLQYADCTSGAQLPLVMFSNAQGNGMLSVVNGSAAEIAFDQAYHCGTPPEQIPYLFGIEVAEKGLFNGVGADGQTQQLEMPSKVYLRHYATRTYLNPSTASTASTGVSGVPGLSNQEYGWTIYTAGTNPPTPPNYLEYLAAELANLDQAQLQQATPDIQASTPAAPQQPQPQTQTQTQGPTYDVQWHNNLPLGNLVGLVESGSGRGLQIVPSVAVAEQALQFNSGLWQIEPTGFDPVTGERKIEGQPHYHFRNRETGHYLALVNGQVALSDPTTSQPGPQLDAEVEWELLPAGAGTSNFHILHAASGNYIFLANGQLFVTSTAGTPWSFN